jgi:hypothetical protein
VQAQNHGNAVSGYHSRMPTWEKVKMGRKPKTTGPTARDAGAFKSILTRVNADGWRALRLLAVEKDTTLNALAVEAFNDLLKKHGKRQSVENPLL